MDNHDKYFKNFYPKFYQVYKPEDAVSDLFKSKIHKILDNICEKNGFKRYKTIDAQETNNNNNNNFVLLSHRTHQYPFPPKQNSCGFISLDLGKEGGHWGAWVYIKEGTGNKIYVWDSMMKGGKYHYSWNTLLKMLFKGAVVMPAQCAMCTRLKGIRLKSNTRQPTGGFVSGEQNMINTAIKKNVPLSPNNYKRITGYESQHHYCFAEALMFLEDVITNKKHDVCLGPRGSLIRIKKYIYDKLTALYPRKNFTDFMKIYNPETKRINTIKV